MRFQELLTQDPNLSQYFGLGQSSTPKDLKQVLDDVVYYEQGGASSQVVFNIDDGYST